ncbi:glycosyltransferase [Alsobacter sp. R-9]
MTSPRPGKADAAAPRREGARAGMERVVSRFASFFFDETRHRSSLPLMASWLVGDGRHRDALSILDRYWRTGPDGVDDRLLQGAILAQLDGTAASLDAFQRAFDIDPNDARAQRALIGSLTELGREKPLRRLARRLVDRARDPAVIELALNALDPDWSFFGSVEERDGFCAGWCAWRGDASRSLTVIADGRRASLPLSAVGHAHWSRAGFRYAPFRFEWPASTAVVDVRDGDDGTSLRGAPMLDDGILERLPARDSVQAQVAVIVPVYDDAVATRRCFDSLFTDGTRLARRIIVVDDASPSPMIRAHLDRLASDGRIELIRNPHNTGFIRAVNRALRRVGGEDIVLLNADTHVPRGWLDRLHAIAAQPGVGTVTPLSNNGELVSVPSRFRASPMPTPERIEAINAAARAAAIPPVDLPNGIGFCLYVRNEALRAVGGLDADRYERGYLEEVDFSLRVAEAGYRNICAPTVFVGHQGEASFGATKRSLVTANAAALMRRWPEIEQQTSAFLRDDPLRPVCGALAWATLDPGRSRRLVLSSSAALDPSVGTRLGSSVDAGSVDLAALCGRPGDPSTWRVRLPGIDAATALPPDARGLPSAEALVELASAAAATDVVVVLDKAIDPEWLDVACQSGLPVDVLPREEWAVSPPGLTAFRLGRSGRPGLRHILAPTATAAGRLDAALDAGPAASVVRLPPPAVPAVANSVPPDASAAVVQTIGIVPTDRSPASFAFVREFAQAMLRRRSNRSLIVLGDTIRDIGLIRLGNVFVTGPLEDEDPAEVLSVHRCRSLLLVQRDRSFINPGIDFVRRSTLPFAAFATGGAVDLLLDRGDGLALDPGWSIDTVAFVVDRVLGRPGTGIPVLDKRTERLAS